MATDWDQIAAAGFAVPADADVDALAADLAEAMADPDPRIRDGAAYAALATWIERGVLDRQLNWLGTAMAGRFSDARIQARTFAALVLAWVIERGAYDESWARAFADWYPAETDLRGYDAKLGWLHAVAHGADLLGVLGRDPRVRPEWMLELGARRMLADTQYVWRDSEDDRLGYAMALILARPHLTIAQSTGWLDLIDQKFATAEPGPVPPYASNTIRTLRMLYLLADRGVRAEEGAPAQRLAHRDKVIDQLAKSLGAVSWFAG
ncbi:MAG TPA: DUF2785 domain-containing protein [Streptosporangiaceae bacterium]|nr:DUF2785 domain-containing protein [Streptosporangiaceae bacterium]